MYLWDKDKFWRENCSLKVVCWTIKTFFTGWSFRVETCLSYLGHPACKYWIQDQSKIEWMVFIKENEIHFFSAFLWNVKNTTHSFEDCPKACSLISEIIGINNLSKASNSASKNKSDYFRLGGVMKFFVANFGTLEVKVAVLK